MMWWSKLLLESFIIYLCYISRYNNRLKNKNFNATATNETLSEIKPEELSRSHEALNSTNTLNPSGNSTIPDSNPSKNSTTITNVTEASNRSSISTATDGQDENLVTRTPEEKESTETTIPASTESYSVSEYTDSNIYEDLTTFDALDEEYTVTEGPSTVEDKSTANPIESEEDDSKETAERTVNPGIPVEPSSELAGSSSEDSIDTTTPNPLLTFPISSSLDILRLNSTDVTRSTNITDDSPIATIAPEPVRVENRFDNEDLTTKKIVTSTPRAIIINYVTADTDPELTTELPTPTSEKVSNSFDTLTNASFPRSTNFTDDSSIPIDVESQFSEDLTTKQIDTSIQPISTTESPSSDNEPDYPSEDDDSPGDSTHLPVFNKSYHQIIDGIYKFGMKLTKVVFQQNLRKNISLPVASITRLLMMLSDGAKGETKNDLYKTLGIPENTSDTLIDKAIAEYLAALNINVKYPSLNTSNLWWHHLNVSTDNSAFSDMIVKKYKNENSTSHPKNFLQVTMANNTAEIPLLRGDTFFSSPWTNLLPLYDPHTKRFGDMAMISINNEELGFNLTCFGSQNHVPPISIFVLTPFNGTDISTVVEHLDNNMSYVDLYSTLKNLQPVTLPTVSFSSKLIFNEINNLSFKDIFQPTADFSGISEMPFFVKNISSTSDFTMNHRGINIPPSVPKTNTDFIPFIVVKPPFIVQVFIAQMPVYSILINDDN